MGLCFIFLDRQINSFVSVRSVVIYFFIQFSVQSDKESHRIRLMFNQIQKQLQLRTQQSRIQSDSSDIFDCLPNHRSQEDLIMRCMIGFKPDNGKTFLQGYIKNRQSSDFGRQRYFKLLVQLVNFAEGEQKIKEAGIYKEILGKLLEIQNNNLHFLSLIPKETFLAIKRYNPITFDRKQRKIQARSQLSSMRKRSWTEQSKGFAEVTLVLNLYFNTKDIELQDTWNRLLTIVGKYNIDFDRITDMILDCFPLTHNQDKIIEISQMFSKDNIKLLLANKISSVKPEKERQILYWGTIRDLMSKSIEDLFFEKIIDINPDYIRILKVFIKHNFFEVKDFEQLLPSLDLKFLVARAFESQGLLESKVNRIVTSLMTEAMCIQDSTEDKILYGQATFCFKMVLMYEYVKNNQFSKFKQMNQSISQGKFKLNLLLFVPLLKKLCQMLEWILDPFLEQHSVNQYFKCKTQRKKKIYFPQGDLKQVKSLNIDSMKIIEEILGLLELNIGFSMKTYIKVCRVFSIYLKFTDENKTVFEEVRKKIKYIAKSFLLGALELQDGNFPMVFQFQKLIFSFDQVQRFEIYSEFINETLLQNVYLVTQYQRNRIPQQIFNRTSAESLNRDIYELRKLMFNHAFRSCHYLVLNIIEDSIGKNFSFMVQIISSTNNLLKDVMLYFIIDHLIKNEEAFMEYYDRPTLKFKAIRSFLFQIYRSNPKLDMTVLFQLVLTRMNESIQQFSSEEEEIKKYNQNFIWMKILSFFIEEICPNLLDLVVRDSAEKCEFLMFGYYLKLQISGKIQQFYETRDTRQKIFTSLCKNRKNGNSYLFDFIVSLNYHLKTLAEYSIRHQQDASLTLTKHANSIDECSILMGHLIKLYCLEYNFRMEENQKEKERMRSMRSEFDYSRQNEERTNYPELMSQRIKPKVKRDILMSYQELSNLVLKYNVDLGLICAIYREYFKEEIQNNNIKELKKLWVQIIHKKGFVSEPYRQIQNFLIAEIKIRVFVRSDFFFYFWMTNNSHLVSLQKKYCSKITEMRRVMADESYIDARIVTKQEKKRIEKIKQNHISAITKISEEKDELSRSYEEFNYISPPGFKPEHREKINKFKIPSEFNSLKDKARNQQEKFENDQLLKEFVSIFFNYCLLPRMLIDPYEAVFCSKFLIRTIKENKFPSNRALIMIFTAIQGAIDYLQYSTDREATKCIPVFVGDLLKLFKDWSNEKEMKDVLQEEINMEKFSERRLEILKDFIFEALCKINQKLIMKEREPFVLKNIMSFLEKTTIIPLCFEQAEELMEYFIRVETDCDDQFVKIRATKTQDLLNFRMKLVATMKNVKNTKKMGNRFEQITKKVYISDMKTKPVDKRVANIVIKKQKQKKVQKKSTPLVIDLTDD